MNTPREQLVTLMHEALSCDLGQGENSYGWHWYGCFEHEADATDNGNCAFAEHIAEAIIGAGWQPPPTPPLTRPSQTIPYLDN